MRIRATVLCVKDGKFLAVKERGQPHFGLPGGGVKKGEQSIVAAIRELHEETGLRTASIEHLANFQGTRGSHRVFIVRPRPGEIQIQRSELSDAQWFNLDREISPDRFQGHVIRSISALRSKNSK
jgi:8-oxo-dGTP pyrophosphatase MutT (NUDIX family)